MLEDQTDCAFILIKLMELHRSVVSSLSFVAMVETALNTCAWTFQICSDCQLPCFPTVVFGYLNDDVVMCCFGCSYFILFLGLFVNFVGNIHGLIISKSCNPILVPLWCAFVALRTAWAVTYNTDNKWDINGDKYRQ